MGPNANKSTTSEVSTAYWCMRWGRGPCSISGAKSTYSPRALVALLKSLGQAFYAQGSGSSPSIAFADVSISCIRLSRRGINDCISGQSLAPAIVSS